jgi:hypothetical protein
MTLKFGDLQGYKIEKAELRDSLNCLNSANDSRKVLHHELMNSSELPENKKQYINEYMREMRYWNFLAYQIVLRELRKQSEYSKENECYRCGRIYYNSIICEECEEESKEG